MIRECPQYVLSPTVVDRFVSEDLIDGLPPEIAVREVRICKVTCAGLVELEGNLVAVVDIDCLFYRCSPGRAVGVERAADEAVLVVVDIRDNLVGRAGVVEGVGGEVLDLGEPVAVVPFVFSDIGIARVEAFAGIFIDIPHDAVAFVVVGIAIGVVGEELVVVAGRVGVAVGRDAVAVVVVRVILTPICFRPFLSSSERSITCSRRSMSGGKSSLPA